MHCLCTTPGPDRITGAVGRVTSFVVIHAAAGNKVDQSVSFPCNQNEKLCVVVPTLPREAVYSLRRSDAPFGHMSWRGEPQVTAVYVQSRLTYFRVPASEVTGGWTGCDTTGSAQ